MKFVKGNPDRIEAAKAAAFAAVDFHGMDGDGIQAPGAIVVREVNGGVDKYAVHFANTQSGGFHGGYYTNSIVEARAELRERARRYDPTGDLHRSFNGEI